MEPRVHRFRGGWAASGGGFATFAATREEALRQYRLHAPRRTCEAGGCESEACVLLEGVALCRTHYETVTSRPLDSSLLDGQPESSDARRVEEVRPAAEDEPCHGRPRQRE